MASRIQLRRGTTAEWLAANPVLAAGEPGVDLDTGLLKVGDGDSTWTALPTGKPAITELAVDKTITTTASYTDVLTTPAFVPSGTTVTVEVHASVSVTAGGQGFVLRAVTGAITEPMGSFYGFQNGQQFAVASKVKVGGLVAGQPYAFTIRAKMVAGTFQCRTATYPESERFAVTIADAAS